MLEVIEKGGPSSEHAAPLLFVDGGLHAAWCWDEHFLDYFAGRGFHAIALSWRCHGASLASKALAMCSIDDYVDDVRHVAAEFGESPVLVGHSVGGSSCRSTWKAVPHRPPCSWHRDPRRASCVRRFECGVGIHGKVCMPI